MLSSHEPEPKGWYLLDWGWVIPLQLDLTGETLKDTARDSDTPVGW